MKNSLILQQYAHHTLASVCKEDLCRPTMLEQQPDLGVISKCPAHNRTLSIHLQSLILATIWHCQLHYTEQDTQFHPSGQPLSSRLVPASKALVRDGEGSLATQCKVVPSQECKLFQVHKEVTWVTAKMPHSGF